MMKNVFNHGLYLFFLSNNVSLGQTLLGPVVGGPAGQRYKSCLFWRRIECEEKSRGERGVCSAPAQHLRPGHNPLSGPHSVSRAE